MPGLLIYFVIPFVINLFETNFQTQINSETISTNESEFTTLIYANFISLIDEDWTDFDKDEINLIGTKNTKAELLSAALKIEARYSCITYSTYLSTYLLPNTIDLPPPVIC